MVFQNSFFTSKLKTKNFLGVVGITSLILITLLIEGILREFGVEVLIQWSYRYIFIAIAISVYVYFVYSQYKKRYNYLYFTDDDKNFLVFRFYQIKLFGKEYVTYKIPVTSFHSFQIREQDSIKQLFLYQITAEKKVAVYPSISLSGCNNHEIHTLQTALQPFVKKK
jgi:hypothetical protein